MMWFGDADGDGSAHAITISAIEMLTINKLCSILSVLENEYYSVENRCRVSRSESF